MARFGKLGWFLGLVFGALFGVLFAPRKGKELRDKMKADRKRGRLGIAPLSDDMMQLGQEIAQIAKDIYYSEHVSSIVEKGRKQMKKISDELVGEVADFHKTRITPVRRKLEKEAGRFGHAVRKGKKVLKEAKKEFKLLGSRLDKSAKIGKRAVREMKKTMRKQKP